MTDIMKLARDLGDVRIMATQERATREEVREAETALQSAIEALQGEVNAADTACELAIKRADAMEAERDALAAELATLKAQEPVGYTDNTGIAFAVKWSGALPPNLTLYAAPKALEPLTDDWIRERCDQTWVFNTVKQWVREIEASHGITKGTP